MTISLAGVRPRIKVAKAAVIADFDHMEIFLNSAGWTLDANGVSVTSAAASGIMIAVGGFNDQRITASMKFISPTAVGGEDICVIGRFLTNQSGSATYYWARQHQGYFKIGKNVDGTFTTLSQKPYVLAQNTFASFTLEMVGTQITGSIDDGTTALTLRAVDSAISGPGAMGFRSGIGTNSTISCRSWTCEEV